ncbi:MAG: tetratricopeptide repeat protein [bacterium]|nr:tetratricopeptide repeat protein [bacterium]
MVVVAGIYGRMGLYDIGGNLLEETLEVVKDRPGNEIIEVTKGFGNLCLQERNYVEAIEWFQKSLDVVNKNPATDPGTVAETKIGLAGALRYTGSLSEAETLVREALPVLVAARSEEHYLVLNAQDSLAGDRPDPQTPQTHTARKGARSSLSRGSRCCILI